MSNFGSQINLIINNISAKLGIAAEKLYPALKQQALIDGITGAIWIIVSLIVFTITLKQLIKWFKNPERVDKDRYGGGEVTGNQVTKMIIGISIVLLTIIIVGVNFNSTVTALFNPNWYIVDKIISSLK